MSVAFVPPQKGRPSPSPAQIQKMLDENSQLIQGIVDYQNKGKAAECLQYQQILHRNLVYLASIADAVPSMLPPPTPIVANNAQITPASEPSPISSPSANSAGAVQQYAPGPYSSNQNQAPHPPYGNNVPMQNSSPSFSNDMPANYPASTSSQGGFGPTTSASSQPPQQQPAPQQQSQQQPPPVTSQAHASPSQDYPSTTISQTTAYNQPAATSAQTYTTHSYPPQTQSYVSSSASSQWYQSTNSQNSTTHSSYPPVTQGYAGPVNHSFSAPVPIQSTYNSTPAAATTQPQNFVPSSSSPQIGFSHHPPQSSTTQESNPSPTPVQQNRFLSSGNYSHSGYMHYRPATAQQPAMGSPMGPPSANVHRPAGQNSSNASQNQNYNYEQSQSYSPYQSQ